MLTKHCTFVATWCIIIIENESSNYKKRANNKTVLVANSLDKVRNYLKENNLEFVRFEEEFGRDFLYVITKQEDEG